MSTVYTMKGNGDFLEVYEDKVTITPKGVLGFLGKGLQGAKTIPFFSITGIRFKETGLVAGYLHFTVHDVIVSLIAIPTLQMINFNLFLK